ncbi:MAG: amidohydrolase family protein [Acidobacteria bacterium]|nr:amidohydrolase family protein [Acidobacteriota bacterium]
MMSFSGRVISLAFWAMGFLSPWTVSGQNVPAILIGYPDLIVFNGKIVTMSDKSVSPALGVVQEAMAVRGDEILALGKNGEILGLSGPKTQKIDLKGHTVIPGIVNAHTHIHDYGVTRWVEAENKKGGSDLPVAAFRIAGSNYEEIKHNIEVTLSEKTSKLRPGQWIFLNLPMRDFVGTYFIQDGQLSMSELDKMMKDHPVLVNAHPAYVINSTAEKRLEQIYDAPHPREEYDESAFGSRIVEFRRMALVDDYFRDKIDKLAEILEQELQAQVAAGNTTFSSHVTGARYMDAYMKLVREKRMPLRFAFTHYMGGLFNPGMEVFAARLGDIAGLGDDYFWFGAISASAIDSGPPMICTGIEAPEDVKKREWCRLDFKRYRDFLYNGLKNHVRTVVGHNYGDKGLDQYLELLDDLVAKEGFTVEEIRAMRLSTDHCGLYPRPDQLPRMKKYGVMLSCGANVLTRTYPWLEKYGMQYANWISPVKSALDAGVKVAFECEEDLYDGLFAYFEPFVTRKNEMGKLVAPQEAVDRNIVMKMATSWSSEFVLREDKVGTLENGKWADFLVLNKDYFTVPVEEIPRVYPVISVVGGQIRYVRSDAAAEFGLQPVGHQLRYSWEKGSESNRPGGLSDM